MLNLFPRITITWLKYAICKKKYFILHCCRWKIESDVFAHSSFTSEKSQRVINVGILIPMINAIRIISRHLWYLKCFIRMTILAYPGRTVISHTSPVLITDSVKTALRSLGVEYIYTGLFKTYAPPPTGPKWEMFHKNWG